MAFAATKREWMELYTFFSLLADGYVYGGTPDIKQNERLKIPVAMMVREEHDGTRRYVIEKDEVHIVGEKIDKRVLRDDFRTVAGLILREVLACRENDVVSPDSVEAFLDDVLIYDLAAKTDDRTDFSVAFYDENAVIEGVCYHNPNGGVSVFNS